MPTRMGLQESKAVLAAGIAAAAALFSAALYLGPLTFAPWPLALALLLLSGAAGAISTWATSGHEYALPLAVLLLPVERLALAVARHGPPPWWYETVDWLMGDEFPLWAGLSLLAAAYAGMLIRCYLRATDCYQTLRAKRAGLLTAEAEKTANDAVTALNLVLVPLLIGGLYATLAEAPESPAVLGGAAVFLLAGVYHAGLVNARSKQAIWLARGVETRPGLESDWFHGHHKALWVLLILLLILPGGFRPLDPAWFIGLFGRQPPAPPRLPNLPRAGMARTGLSILRQGILAKILDVISGFFLVVLLLAAILIIAGVALLLLQRLGGRLTAWCGSLRALWSALKRFCSSLMALLRGRIVRGLRAIGRPIRRLIPARASRARGVPGRIWPASRVRKLFARLILRGREAGLRLPPSMSPAEMGDGLARFIPESREDLASIVEIYSKERYGEMRLSRGERSSFGRAWARVMRGAEAKSAPEQSGRDGKDGT